MKRAAWAAVVSLLFWSASSHALPRFAIQQGTPCSNCHVNPTGGGARNAYGRGVFARQVLPGNFGAPRNGFPLIDPVLGEFVAIGMDARAAFIHTLPRADVPESRALPTTHTFMLMQADLYVNAQLPPYLDIYFDQGTYGSQEIYLRPKLGLFSIKVGKFLPAYGWRLPDHTALIREPIGLGPRAKDTGLSLVFDHANLTVELGMFNGAGSGALADIDLLRAFSGRAEGRVRLGRLNLHLGASGYVNESGEGDAQTEMARYGTFFGIGLGRLGLLGELDLTRDGQGDSRERGYVVYSELSLVALRGLQIAATYEFNDPSTNIAGDAIHRAGGTVELYPWPNVELDVMVRNTMGNPDNPVSRTVETVVMLHGYL